MDKMTEQEKIEAFIRFVLYAKMALIVIVATALALYLMPL